jgi:hypothetical protein
MTADRRGRATPLASVALALTLAAAAAACAQEADPADFAIGDVEFEATPEFVAEAAERSTDEPYRWEADLRMQLAFAGESIDVDAPFMSGEQDGELSRSVIDMGALFEELDEMAPPGGAMPPELADADLTMETVADSSTMYLRAPLFEALAEMGGGAASGQLGPMAELAELGDDWGRVDLDALGDVLPLNDLASTAGGQATDPSAFFDLVTAAEEVQELGDAAVRGVTVRGVGAEITLGELFEASGMDPDEFAESMGNALPSDADTFIEAMLDVSMPIEAWIDGDGYVRRLVYEMDLLAMFESAGSSDDLGGDAPDEFSYGFTMDFLDYGDDSILIELPDADDAVDVTDAFLETYAGSET